MADRPASERTEQPTAERLKKARARGQLPQSMEVPSAMMLGMLLVVLALMSSTLSDWFIRQVHSGLYFRLGGPMDSAAFSGMLQARALEVLTILLPFLLAAGAVSVLGSVLVGGWSMSFKAISWDISKLSPIAGLKNLFSGRSLVHLLTNLVKLAVMVAIVWHFLSDRWQQCIALTWAQPMETLAYTARLVLGLVTRIAVAMAVIAGADLLYQKWSYKRNLRMTRQEVKEERREHEGSPLVKVRMRAIHFEMVRKRMLQEVPKADVVLANPTHVAVALKYEAGGMDAPLVVAKGADLLSEKIKEVARAHGVPIVYRPELARTIWKTVEIGKPIPQTLFVAVAEVLAMIYRTRRRGH